MCVRVRVLLCFCDMVTSGIGWCEKRDSVRVTAMDGQRWKEEADGYAEVWSA